MTQSELKHVNKRGNSRYRNTASRITKTWNIMSANDLATIGARSSAGVTLTNPPPTLWLTSQGSDVLWHSSCPLYGLTTAGDHLIYFIFETSGCGNGWENDTKLGHFCFSTRLGDNGCPKAAIFFSEKICKNIFSLNQDKNGNGNLVMLTQCSSLTAPDIMLIVCSPAALCSHVVDIILHAILWYTGPY